MFHDTYHPPDFGSDVTRRMIEFMGKIGMLYREHSVGSTRDVLSENSRRLLAEAEREIGRIRHDLEAHTLNRAERLHRSLKEHSYHE